MNKLKKKMMLLGVFLMSSLAFVACSDDDGFPKNTMGAVNVNSCVTTSTTAELFWTIVSNGSCAGYEVTIFEGTREDKGTEVIHWTTSNPKEANHTFEGLEENTSYVVSTKAIPAQGSGFTSAQSFELQFMTAPLVPVENSAMEVKLTEIVNKDGIRETVDMAHVTVTWKDIPTSNRNSYNVSIYKASQKDIDSKNLVESKTVSINTTTFSPLELNTTYTVVVSPTPNASCWYLTGDPSYYELTTPEK